MKIENSTVAMASNHYESVYTFKESMTMEANASRGAAGAILTLSRESSGMSYKESMQLFEKQQQEEAAKKRQENETKSLQDMADRMRTEGKGQFDFPDEFDLKIKMLRQVLAVLRGEKVPEDCKIKPEDSKVLDLRSAQFRKMEGIAVGASASSSARVAVGGSFNAASGNVWQKITATSGYSSEFEATTFASTGIVKTQDGRNIGFNIEVSMTRAFTSQIDSLEVKEYIKTDPLIINLDSNITSVSDQKFLFDLDSDGRKERISFAGEGSGFLALDKNGDGKINDGSELFGTKSGDGFRDLAGYDEDGNGWIDENDDVFSKLKVWTKDSEGKDVLLDFKKADVGAIYLGSADTQFSLKNEVNELNAEVKKTGVYLKESTGAVGTLNHVDLAI